MKIYRILTAITVAAFCFASLSCANFFNERMTTSSASYDELKVYNVVSSYPNNSTERRNWIYNPTAANYVYKGTITSSGQIDSTATSTEKVNDDESYFIWTETVLSSDTCNGETFF